MRDLEKKISDWRHSMAQTSKHRPEALDELETHLRDEIQRLMRAGTAADEAFGLAASRLGPADAVCAEFQKLEEMRRAKWRPATFAQWACVVTGVVVALALTPRIGHGQMTLLLFSHVLTVTIGYVTMFIVGALAICHVLSDWFDRTGHPQTYHLRRTMFRLAVVSATLTGIGIVLGMIWAKENWGRYWAWDAKETGAVIVLVCAMLPIALRWFKPTSYNALAATGLLGNIGTAWGWFGANMLGKVNPMLVAFIASQCLILMAFVATTWLRKPQTLHD
jgi:hypothetical protein